MTMIEGRDGLRTAGGLKLWTRSEGSGTVLTVSGEIDMESSTALREVLTDLIETGSHLVVVSMGGVTFLDSTGLQALIHARKQIREHRGALRLVGLRSGPAKVIEITGLRNMFPIWDTVEDALAFD